MIITLSGVYTLNKMVKKNLVYILILLPVIAISVIIFLNRDKIYEFEKFGYLGAFLISLVSNASIFLPAPGLLLLFALGATFNPVLVGIVGGTGGTIGELSGYIVGYSGRGIAQNNKWFIQAEKWLKKWGMLTIFLFSLIPVLPFDAAALAAGVAHFSIRKFLIACLVGKTLLYIGMALFGAWGWEALLRYMD
jgi:uncharacterized membrane protein YdjX (TVP38/TMEM64 family)